jgi:hypothetical protein
MWCESFRHSSSGTRSKRRIVAGAQNDSHNELGSNPASPTGCDAYLGELPPKFPLTLIGGVDAS